MFTITTHLFTLALIRSAYVVLFYMTGLFVLALIERRNDVADVGWGIGFIVVALFNFLTAPRITVASLVVTLLVFIWGMRLSIHIHRRNKGKQEDFRYRKLREEWGKWFAWRSYLQVFLLQGVLMLLISFPIILINSLYIPYLPFLAMVGVIVWIIGFVFESVGDRELSRFSANPENKEKLLMTGLWRYTRHPNYFGEVTEWWGIFIIVLSGYYGWIGIVGPLTITFLILKISGIPMLEKSMEQNPEFAEYKRRTSMFIPMPPKVRK